VKNLLAMEKTQAIVNLTNVSFSQEFGLAGIFIKNAGKSVENDF